MINFFEKKIFVILKGGLGNQLLIYASAENFAKKNNINKIIYINSGDLLDRFSLENPNFKIKNNQDIRFYFKNFKIKDDFLKIKYINFIYFFLKYRLFNKVITDQNIADHKLSFFQRRITMFGFFLNKKCFIEQIPIIAEKIYLHRLKNLIKKKNTVISLSKYAQPTTILSNKYYLRSLKKLKITHNENIIITSDDLEYAENVRAILNRKGYKKIKINLFNRKSAFDDFKAIVNSKKLIMSNSSFCLWASVLRSKIGHSNNKVVCPKNWLHKKYKKKFKNLNFKIFDEWNYL
jgi:hypothetical protein